MADGDPVQCSRPGLFGRDPSSTQVVPRFLFKILKCQTGYDPQSRSEPLRWSSGWDPQTILKHPHVSSKSVRGIRDLLRKGSSTILNFPQSRSEALGIRSARGSQRKHKADSHHEPGMRDTCDPQGFSAAPPRVAGLEAPPPQRHLEAPSAPAAARAKMPEAAFLGGVACFRSGSRGSRAP